jgi:hypothetical protein
VREEPPALRKRLFGRKLVSLDEPSLRPIRISWRLDADVFDTVDRGVVSEVRMKVQ